MAKLASAPGEPSMSFKISIENYDPHEARQQTQRLMQEITELEMSLKKWAEQGYGPIVRQMTTAELRDILSR